VATRRYHGALVAALPAPLGRVVMLNHLEEHALVPGQGEFRLAGDETRGREVVLPDPELLEQFWLDFGLPRWRYDLKGVVLEKLVVMPHLQNSTFVIYRLVSAPGPVTLRIQPSLHYRGHEEMVSGQLPQKWRVTEKGPTAFEITGPEGFPPLRISLGGGGGRLDRTRESLREHVIYRLEHSRGYESEGALWSPGTMELTLQPGATASFVASTEPWDAVLSLDANSVVETEHHRRRQLLERAGVPAPDVAAQLILAADQFIIAPHTRTADEARIRAAGDEPRTIIAGYHWFTDWGRDTMISLEGLTLTTGRHREAGSILRTFGHYVRDGLIPNMFPEGTHEGLYHTADATLWFFQAIHRYLQWTADRATLRLLLPTLRSIAEHHLRGTRFKIGVDPADGLLAQGEEGYQLTWMDAKVDGWVVTPRRGKAVEINALFYNALRLLERWLVEEDLASEGRSIGEHADRVYESFNRRFPIEGHGYLFDVVDGEAGDDPAFRPNQIFAVSLEHPVLDPSRWASVVEQVHQKLVTPVGLRSLSRAHPDYKKQYYGDLRARDAAYHQGTVWGWLIGPFVDAWLKVHPGDHEGARALLHGFIPHLGDAGIGTISEIFDAEPPYTPRGCIAQAWSVAEVLRCSRMLAGT
jgi:predicted glycogen debranching enzyme